MDHTLKHWRRIIQLEYGLMYGLAVNDGMFNGEMIILPKYMQLSMDLEIIYKTLELWNFAIFGEWTIMSLRYHGQGSRVHESMNLYFSV